MSTSGLFQILTNDGKQDKILLASELLSERLKTIRKQRCKNPAINDPTPTLVDIEKTHLFFMNAHFKPFVTIGYEYNTTGVQEGVPDFGREITFSIPQFGDFFHDMAVHVKLTNLLPGPTSTQVRYHDFLGHRLLKRVRFEVNGNFLDEYTSNAYNFHYQFRVSENKKIAWKRCVGQEVPVPAFLTQNPLVDNYREVRNIYNGPQTPKNMHEEVEMYIPLLFWFNQDPRLSIPAVSIPYGQRFIKIQLAEANEVASGLPTTDIIPPVFDKCELYINNIFVNPEIHDIFIKRVGFTLIRVHREELVNVDESSNILKIDQLKYPIETLYLGIRPNINENNPENWWRYSFPINNTITYPVAVPNPGPAPPNHVLGFANANYTDYTSTIDTLEIETLGVKLWKQTPGKFFNSYIPETFGGANISSPVDIGAHMVPFNLYPGSYQPSGHFNSSRTREVYFNYTSSVISPGVPGELIIVAVALNFLIIADGGASLRYYT